MRFDFSALWVDQCQYLIICVTRIRRLVKMTERFIYTCQPVVKRWWNSMSMHPLQYYSIILYSVVYFCPFNNSKWFQFISWEFLSENGDVAFAIYHMDGEKMIPIVPQQRIDSHTSTEKGEIHCQETGKCIGENF